MPQYTVIDNRYRTTYGLKSWTNQPVGSAQRRTVGQRRPLPRSWPHSTAQSGV